MYLVVHCSPKIKCLVTSYVKITIILLKKKKKKINNLKVPERG